MFFDGNDSGFLHIGDIISLYTEGAITGFLSSLGVVDDRCVVEPDQGVGDEPPKKFRDCLFEVCPVNRYASQKELWKFEKRISSSKEKDDQVKAMLKALRSAAQKEREQNDTEAKARRGKTVQYGELIQLKHVKSRKYITVNRNEAARVERTAFRVYLDGEGNDGSAMYIEPFLKIRSNGDRVVVGDKIMLVPQAATSRISVGKNQIHVSQHALFDGLNFKEVNCLSERTCWKVNLFLQYDENEAGVVKGGDVVRLFHAEKQMYLTLDEYQHIPTVYLRKTDQTDARMALNPKALWEVEVVQDDVVRGARGRWCDLYRFKHLATGMYLVAELDNDATAGRDLKVTRTSPTGGPNPQRRFRLVAVPSSYHERSTLFQFDPTTVISSQEDPVMDASYIRLRHFFTGTWVHSTDIRYDGKSMYKVGSGYMREDQEAFVIIPVPNNEVRDLDFANDSTRSLNQFLEGLSSGKEALSFRAINPLRPLLSELICFLCYRPMDVVYSYSWHDLLKMTPRIKERGRQKMLREQDVLLVC